MRNIVKLSGPNSEHIFIIGGLVQICPSIMKNKINLPFILVWSQIKLIMKGLRLACIYPSKLIEFMFSINPFYVRIKK